MKLVVFSRDFSEYCFRYANAMARYCDVLLILDRDITLRVFDIASVQKQPRLTVHLVDLASKRSAPVSLIITLWRIIRFRPDYIHLQEVPDRIAPVLALIFRRFFKIIWTVHDPFPHIGRDSELARDMTLLRDCGRRQASLFVLHGSTCVTSFVRAFPAFANRVLVSQHGVLMVPPAGTRGPGHCKTLLFFGRMEEYKGLDTLIDAVALLDQRGVDYRVVIAGKGPELDKRLARLEALPRAEVISGFISPDLAAQLFQHAALVVLPYKEASQSGVAAAAFGNHRPVIACRVGGLPDVVDHGSNGMLVAPDDAVALADSLQEVLENRPLLRHLEDGARKTAQAKLNWDRIALELFEQISAPARSRPAVSKL